MIELKKNFRKYGWEFTQLLKREDICVYKKTKTYEDGYTSVDWELFTNRIERPNKFMDDYFERYPSDEEFGVRGWDCSCIGSCEKVLKKHFPTVNMEEVMKVIVEFL